jgi:uncharacterized protein YciI
MPYLIETWDKPDHQHVRQAARPDHLRYLERIGALLIACGAKLNDDGSDAGGGIYIVDVDSRAQADALIAADPFTAVDLFQKVEIRRWRKAYVDGTCRL